MKTVLILCGLVVLCNGQYNYNAPSANIGSGGSFSSGASFGSSSGLGIGSSSGVGFGSSSGSSFGSSSGVGFGGSSGGSLGLGSAGGFSSGANFASGSSGVSSGFVGGGAVKQTSFAGAGYASQAPIVHKHVYVHVAPEEPEEQKFRAAPQLPAPTKHYKIIFVKAPSPPAYSAPIIPAQQQNEEKTLVYVLVKKPDDQPDVVIPTSAPTQPSKPEVYFIKYKTNKQSVGGGAVGGGIQTGGVGIGGGIGGAGVGIGGGIGGSGIGGSGIGGTGFDSDSISVADLARSGASTSGSPAAKYGPPGYQH